MPVTLASLLPPVTPDQVKALLISALQGLGPVQQTGQGLGTVVVSGTPSASYDANVIIQGGGAPGTATFTYSLDLVNYAGPYTVPANGTYVASGTGLTIQFAGVFTSGDQYAFTTIYPPFPVTDWQEGGVGRTFLEMEAAVLADLVGNAIPAVAGGGLVDYASSANAPNDWLSLLSQEVYNNYRFQPANAQGLITLTLAAGSPNVTFAAGQLLVADTTGANQHIFTNPNPITIFPGTIFLPVTAAQSGAAYNLVNGAITVLLTPRPGLTVTNPAPGLSSLLHIGSGAGTVGVSGSSAGNNYYVKVKVTTSGAPGTGMMQVSLDNGANYAAPVLITSIYPIPLLNSSVQTGLVLAMAGNFVSGDSYSFSSYGYWLQVLGLDAETDGALRQRDKAKWTTLGVGSGTPATLDYLARTTPGGGSEVFKTYSQPDPAIAGQVDLVVSGAGGPVSTGALAAITAYLTPRIALGTKLSVQNSTAYAIPITGTVYATAAMIPAVTAAIAAAIQALQQSIPIGGTVYANSIVEIIEAVLGVRNVNLTSPTPNTFTVLPAANVATMNGSLVYVGI